MKRRYMLVAMVEGEDDLSVVRRIASGDRTAMRALYGRHQLKVFRFVSGMLRDRSQVEDVVNDVFFEVWVQAGRFEQRSTVSTWLLGIARYKALTVARRRRDNELDEEMAEAVPDTADTPETSTQKLDKAAALRRCVATLPAEHRAVVDLVYYHDKSVEEVGMILAIPAATVKTRMFYARKKLAEMMVAAGIDRGWP
jgi:RNA polymerase sigma-70 factor, ECF subfamily